MLKKYNWLWLDLGLMVVLFISSSMPYHDQSIVPELHALLPAHSGWAWLNHISFYWAAQHVSISAMGLAGFVEFFVRKLAHFTVFCLIGLAAVLGLRARVQPSWLRLVLALLSSTGVAALDEFHQMLTADRTPLFQDVILDTVGALVGIGIALLVTQRRRRPKKRSAAR
ncbi:VanZ family protein [Lacticaseibacillus camelliae]|uniref:Integral membrane protein n=2 Tax=Lacticaseibacillus camelliae TaxID=381742 RepID=A0A0R2FLP8_9LACO|nr:VanZ family protein [Lacticaseibacillus camelliae]KRN25357.1 integral membrane protein [Lacticaseibacillus camelliae DSM 22697 = JCM 13995]